MSAMARRVLVVATAAVLFAAGCGSSGATGSSTSDTSGKKGLQGTIQTPPTHKPEFVLTDTAGHRFDFGAETKGQLTFLYFGYTNCPDICHIRMQQLAAVEARPHVPKAKVVFVTVDPARDTAKVMRTWLGHFDRSFIGLTGTPAQIETAEQASGVPPATRQPGTRLDQYFMSHPSNMQAFAPDGRGYTVYPFGTTIAEYVHDMDILVKRVGA